jgi:hypothetical protein
MVPVGIKLSAFLDGLERLKKCYRNAFYVSELIIENMYIFDSTANKMLRKLAVIIKDETFRSADNKENIKMG